MSWKVVMTGDRWSALQQHLFPGDGDEHGAILRCSMAKTPSGTRLLVRDVIVAVDGRDYVPGSFGYRKLTADFVLDAALAFSEDTSVYIAVHCHGGHDQVGFSDTDLESHKLGYPGLLELIGAPVVGALVFAQNAVAGEFWLRSGEREILDELIVTDPVRRVLTPLVLRPGRADESYDRQARLFGDRGQDLLRGQKIGVVGLGGAGSLVAQLLARLGVGHLVLIDDDRVETSNLSRIVGATRWDAHTWLTDKQRPQWMQQLGLRFAARKVAVARRVCRQSSAQVKIDAIVGRIEDPDVAALLVDADHVFLCADAATARLVVNALAHQYLVPVTQVGAKAVVDERTGSVIDVFAVSRLLMPGRTCLKCNGLISPARLREEATEPEQLKRQRYVEDDGVHAPSVITLNSVATSHAVNDWLMRATGLYVGSPNPEWMHADSLDGIVSAVEPRQDADCTLCGSTRFARGDDRRLPTKLRQ